MMMASSSATATNKTSEPKLVTADTNTVKLIKKNKNYTSDLFPDEERYQIYHVIDSYPSVNRFWRSVPEAVRGLLLSITRH
jgi:hypothetical protein